jgi:hypothetical protein
VRRREAGVIQRWVSCSSGHEGSVQTGRADQDDLILLDFIGHAVGLHAQGSGRVDGLGIGTE